MVRQALRDCPDKVCSVFCTEESAAAIADDCRRCSIAVYITTNGVLSRLIGTGYTTGTAAAAVIDLPKFDPDQIPRKSGLILVGESIQDPRNVGVLVRTADALGCDGLLLTSDSADPWQRAAIRSTTGSVLRLPIALTDRLADTLQQWQEHGTIVVGSSGAAPTLIHEMDLTRRPLALIVGNEQSGMAPETMTLCDHVVRLPMAASTRADSLNVTVAAGMLLGAALIPPHS